jgi:hypothetical protein
MDEMEITKTALGDECWTERRAEDRKTSNKLDLPLKQVLGNR